MAQLHMNDDNTWSVTASSEEEALDYVADLNGEIDPTQVPMTLEEFLASLAEQDAEDEE